MLVDTNLLIYATFADSPEHRAARAWLEGLLSDERASVALCWPVLYAFARLITSARVFGDRALGVAQGWSTAAHLLDQPAVRVVVPGERHAGIAAELAATPGLRSDDVPDIEVAALAIEHGLVLASRDSGFRRFSAVRCLDPLA